MLKERSRFLQRALFFVDILLIVLGWISAYFTRFELLTPPQWLPLSTYLDYLPAVTVLWIIVFWMSGLYATDRAQRLPRMLYVVAKAVFFGMVAAVASLFFYRAFSFSRLHMLLFGVYTSAYMVLARVVLYAYLRRARNQGKNLKHVLIVGAGETGKKLSRAFEQYPWIGFNVVGFLDDTAEGSDILGTTDEVTDVLQHLEDQGISVDYVYLTLPLSEAKKIEQIVDTMSRELAHVYLVPDLFQFDIINSRITDIDGLPVIHLIDEVPLEINLVIKRAMDLIVSLLLLIVLSPVFLIIGVAVKLSSPGPVFYRQTRMGLNGHTFEILKFRSMPTGTEEDTGPVWASEDDDRTTAIGKYLRQTSLDELPQLINVIKGDMSLVGPRPERPVFIEEFRNRVPRYMLRHKMKAGITGWAQVNGWRGDTSIKKRIECDLYYIQNWSLTLDLKIIWLTIWGGLTHENAY
jgi:Undecaprenyl-phosphate glucose phosphotransferase